MANLREPWFLALNASAEMHPVMIFDDLIKAGPHIEAAVKTYGKHTHGLLLSHT